MTGRGPDADPGDGPWQRRPEALWRRGLDSVVVLGPTAADVLTIGGSGPLVWELLAEPWTASGLSELLARERGARQEDVEGELLPMIGAFLEIGALDDA